MAKNTPRKKRPPSKKTEFEMSIREEVDLNVTCRLLWLLTALSHDGHTFLSQAAMAEQLHTSPWQIQTSLKIICAITPRLFRRVPMKGVHRPDQYKRCYLKGESEDDFVLRALSWEGMDACVGLHWVACINLGKEPDGTTFSAHGRWPVSEDTLRRARVKMNRLGHFKVESDPKTGKPATYIPNYSWAATADAPEQRIEQPVRSETVKPVEKVTSRPTLSKQEKREREALAKRDEERRQREAWAEHQRQQEQEHQRKLAEEMGVNLDGETRHGIHTVKGTKSGKRVISIEQTKVEIDENDL